MKREQKRNEDYWDLKARIDEWGTTVTVLIPLLTLTTLGFGGAAVGNILFGSNGFLIGFLIGGLTAQVICLTYWRKKIGFIMHSKAGCQSCGLPLAQYRLRRLRLAKICRDCGNDNRVNLHAP